MKCGIGMSNLQELTWFIYKDVQYGPKVVGKVGAVQVANMQVRNQLAVREGNKFSVNAKRTEELMEKMVIFRCERGPK